MKKKLFLVLCSCFAGALALSSCGGGGGNELPDPLAPFVRGNYSIFFEGNSTVKVVSQGTYGITKTLPNQILVDQVYVNCTSKSGASATGKARYTMTLVDGVPVTLEVYFSDLTATGNGDNASALPIENGVTATMTSIDVNKPFQLGDVGQVRFWTDDPDVPIPGGPSEYAIYPGSQGL